jgi:2-polyprenyl-3-methyl-5-hydroxy-6-metoxy-1,4-benzoquinol methylase
MTDLSERSTRGELMDDPGISPADYNRCLADLEQVNRYTLTHRATLQWLDQAVAGLPPETPMTILDVACGHGDLLRAIYLWARERGRPVVLQGLDLNPASAHAARAATPVQMPITYRTGNVFTDVPQPRPDLIVSSQFTHHLSDAEVVTFLHWLERYAQRGWYIADLHRHAIPYYGFRVLATLAGWHRIVRYDGTVSIARSFRRHDWEVLLERAGLHAQIRWHMPFRLCVGRLK